MQRHDFEGKEQQVLSAIHKYAAPDTIEIAGDLALVAVVGRGMKSTRGTAGRIFSALAHAQVNVKMIDQGSSELNVIVGVNDGVEVESIRQYDNYKLEMHIDRNDQKEFNLNTGDYVDLD